MTDNNIDVDDEKEDLDDLPGGAIGGGLFPILEFFLFYFISPVLNITESIRDKVYLKFGIKKLSPKLPNWDELDD